MSENATLTPAQSKIVRDLEKSIDNFHGQSMFHPTEDVRIAHRAVAVHFRELEAEFPEIAKEATAYYESEEHVEYPEEMEGYGGALFALLLTLRAFYDAESIGRVFSLHNDLYDHLSDFRSFSKEYNWERGFWNDEVEAV